jgi:hypothetical protein
MHRVETDEGGSIEEAESIGEIHMGKMEVF